MPKRTKWRIDEAAPISGAAAEVIISADDPAPPAQPPVPAPSGLTLSTTLQRSAVTAFARISATWNAPAGTSPQSYAVQWSEDPAFPTNATAGADAYQPSAAIDQLKTNTTYSVRVAAVLNGTQGAWSAAASITTASDTTPPGPPTSAAVGFTAPADLVVSCINPTSPNFRAVQIAIYDSPSKTYLYALDEFASGRYVWTAAANIAATNAVNPGIPQGSGDPSVYVELRSISTGGVLSTIVSASATKSQPATPGTITSDFSGRDAIWNWAAAADAVRWQLTIDGTPRTVATNAYTYLYRQNQAEHSPSGADKDLTWSLVAIDGLGQVSATPATGTLSNPAPSAPTSVSLTGGVSTLSVLVNATQPPDFQAYRFRLIQTSPAAADVTWDDAIGSFARQLQTAATYQIGVRIVDAFGQVSSTETLSSSVAMDFLTLPDLRAGALYSDSLSTAADTLKAALSDDNRASGGITYGSSGVWNRWIRMERPLFDRYKQVTLSITPASGTTSWYLRTSPDGVTWSYFAGPVTSGRVLTAVANATAAQSAAVSAATLGGASANRVELPAMADLRFVEVWLRNTAAATRVDEFYPRRLVQGDDAEFETFTGLHVKANSLTADRLLIPGTASIDAGLQLIAFRVPVTLDAGSGIYQGSGTFASPTTGLKLYNASGIGRLAGYNAGVEQLAIDTDGRLKAGGGNVVLEAAGISMAPGTFGTFSDGAFDALVEIVSNSKDVAWPVSGMDRWRLGIVGYAGASEQGIHIRAKRDAASGATRHGRVTLSTMHTDGTAAYLDVKGSDKAILVEPTLRVGVAVGTQPLIAIGASSTYPTAAYLVRTIGDNGTLFLYNRGTGAYNLGCQDAGTLQFVTSNAGRMTIDPSGNVVIASGTLTLNNYLSMPEYGDPGPPGVNGARLYTRDNGSGKTQLCIVFNTGAVQVLATQP